MSEALWTAVVSAVSAILVAFFAMWGGLKAGNVNRKNVEEAARQKDIDDQSSYRAELRKENDDLRARNRQLESERIELARNRDDGWDTARAWRKMCLYYYDKFSLYLASIGSAKLPEPPELEDIKKEDNDR